MATAGTAVSVPLLVISPQLGIAASVAGVTAINKAFFNKKKLRKPNVPKKGEIRGKKRYRLGRRLMFTFGKIGEKTAKAALIMGTGGLALGYKRAYEDSKIDFQKIYGHKNIEEGFYETSYPDMLNKLQEAQDIEQEIVEQIEEIQVSEVQIESAIKTAKVDKRSQEAQEKIHTRLDDRQLDQALSKTFDTIDTDTIQQVVAEYMVKNKLDNITTRDIREIQKAINEKLRGQGKMITVTDEFTNDIRDEVRRQLNYSKKQNENNVTLEKGKETAKEKVKLDLKDIEQLCHEVAKENNIEKIIVKEIMKDVTKDKKVKEALEKEHRDFATKRITELIEEKIKNQQATEAFKKRMEEKFNISKGPFANTEQEQKIDEVITKLRPQQLIELMQASLRNGKSIDRNLDGNKFAGLMENVVKLNAINNDYAEMSGERIYENVDELIKSLRKQFRNRNKKGGSKL